MERKSKGVWIPIEIWESKELTIMEKIMFVEIDSLDNDKGCYASNKYFSEWFDLSKGRCSQIIKSLALKGFITISYERKGKEISRRVIKSRYKYAKVPIKNTKHPSENTKGGYLENDNTPSENTKGGYLENDKENNTSLTIQSKNNTEKNKAGIKFPSNSSQFILANQFREILLKYKSDSKVPANTEQGLQTWSQDIDYMMRLDKRDPKKILELIDWTQRDSFWCSNIRSPRKLREKWDTLELQKNKANAGGTKERVRTVENVQNEWEDFINGNF